MCAMQAETKEVISIRHPGDGDIILESEAIVTPALGLVLVDNERDLAEEVPVHAMSPTGEVDESTRVYGLGQWMLYHRTTGIFLSAFNTQEEGMEAAEFLSTLPVNWDKHMAGLQEDAMVFAEQQEASFLQGVQYSNPLGEAMLYLLKRTPKLASWLVRPPCELESYATSTLNRPYNPEEAGPEFTDKNIQREFFNWDSDDGLDLVEVDVAVRRVDDSDDDDFDGLDDDSGDDDFDWGDDSGDDDFD